MGRVDTDLCGGSPAGGECWGGTTPQAPSGASDQEDGAEGRVSSPRPPEGAMVRAEPSPHRGQGPRLPCLGSTKQSPQQAFPGTDPVRSSRCPPAPESWPVGHRTTATPVSVPSGLRNSSACCRQETFFKAFISAWTSHLRQTTADPRKPLGLSHWLPVLPALTGNTASLGSAGSLLRAPSSCAEPHRF